MIKKKLLFLLFFLQITIFAQEDYNVLSYYAVDNSLDGQPRIDMVNVLKFYPVFAIQDSVKNVNVTIYYGNKIYDANADKMNGGKYWQTLLPEFKLGDALQRVEVEMTFNVHKAYLAAYELVKDSLNTQLKSIKENREKVKSKIQNDRKVSQDELREIREQLKNLLMKTDSIKLNSSLVINFFNRFGNELPKIQIQPSEKLKEDITSTLRNTPFIRDSSEKIINQTAQELIKLLNNNSLRMVVENLISQRMKSITELEGLNNKLITFKKEEYKITEKFELESEKLKQKLFEGIIQNLSDTSFSGPAIRKSDLVISEDFQSATLLYRYYKNNLRYRKALDPAESLGIFRARYVPFPVVGRPSDNRLKLLRPMEANVPVVFEIGLAFGDEVVSGDNTFKPAFSLSRLGVAIVITEKLFKADADILGLALTYDFNSYASIGVGRNLAQGQSYPYYSFGINKKAFEQLLAELAGLFK